MKIAKEFRWEMGHRLLCHNGKCFNLHGHSYKLIVEFSGGITEEGMVLDYFDVKEIIAPLVDELDHSVIISSKDLELKEAIQKLNSAHVIVDFESTAENLCHYFLNKIKAEKLPPNITKIKVRVCETENTYAEEEVSLIDYSQHD
ncbi:MAG: 6-carboxytetrahydropterin synthase [Ignavibacteriae bacterium]|nr:6-carboxytetrahydropterin synthase [Ignavibacteriota bacterium]